MPDIFQGPVQIRLIRRTTQIIHFNRQPDKFSRIHFNCPRLSGRIIEQRTRNNNYTHNYNKTKQKTTAEQDRTGQDRTEQNRTEQNRTEQNRTEQNRTEQNRTEQNNEELNEQRAQFCRYYSSS
jgi:hypothetical protein